MTSVELKKSLAALTAFTLMTASAVDAQTVNPFFLLGSIGESPSRVEESYGEDNLQAELLKFLDKYQLASDEEKRDLLKDYIDSGNYNIYTLWYFMNYIDSEDCKLDVLLFLAKSRSIDISDFPALLDSLGISEDRKEALMIYITKLEQQCINSGEPFPIAIPTETESLSGVYLTARRIIDQFSCSSNYYYFENGNIKGYVAVLNNGHVVVCNASLNQIYVFDSSLTSNEIKKNEALAYSLWNLAIEMSISIKGQSEGKVQIIYCTSPVVAMRSNTKIMTAPKGYILVDGICIKVVTTICLGTDELSNFDPLWYDSNPTEAYTVDTPIPSYCDAERRVVCEPLYNDNGEVVCFTVRVYLKRDDSRVEGQANDADLKPTVSESMLVTDDERTRNRGMVERKGYNCTHSAKKGTTVYLELQKECKQKQDAKTKRYRNVNQTYGLSRVRYNKKGPHL